jgi:hypothetical protein
VVPPIYLCSSSRTCCYSSIRGANRGQSHALRPRAIETRKKKPKNAMVWIS